MSLLGICDQGSRKPSRGLPHRCTLGVTNVDAALPSSLQEKRLSTESGLSGASAPSACTVSEGEPEILLTEEQGLGQQNTMLGQEEDIEEDYDEVRADRKGA